VRLSDHDVVCQRGRSVICSKRVALVHVEIQDIEVFR